MPLTSTKTPEGAAYVTRYDFGATYIYVGTAAVGTTVDSSAWSVKRITLDSVGNPIITAFAFNVCWDDRATTSYY